MRLARQLVAKICIRPAPEKFIKVITFTAFAIFAIVANIESFIQMLSTVTRDRCHSERTRNLVIGCNRSRTTRFFAFGLRMTPVMGRRVDNGAELIKLSWRTTFGHAPP